MLFAVLFIVVNGIVAGQAYYLNLLTKESQWDEPKEPAQSASSKPGPDKVSYYASSSDRGSFLIPLRKNVTKSKLRDFWV